jgi:uncharacterized damage-inducible protein DinB
VPIAAPRVVLWPARFASSALMRSMSRTLSLGVFLGAAPLVAQQTSGQVSITAPLEKQYAGDLTVLHGKVAALAAAIPEDRYSWRPSEQVRTVAQLLMHIAGEWYYICPRSLGAQPPKDFGSPGDAMRKLEQVTRKAEILPELEKAWAHCQLALENVDPRKLVPDSLPSKMGFPRVVLLVSGDQHEHLGQLIAYARSIGIVPPWSK